MWVEILQDIKRPDFTNPFWRYSSYVRYDHKSAVEKKTHCLVYCQGRSYGSVGDQCDYLTHAELLELANQGLIRFWRGAKQETHDPVMRRMWKH